MTCGGCYHYRRGRCKNKHASTYNGQYDPNSQPCQMYLTGFIKPFGSMLKTIVMLIVIPLQLISILSGGDPTVSNHSDDSGFEI